jgi:hypothetical protein
MYNTLYVYELEFRIDVLGNYPRASRTLKKMESGFGSYITARGSRIIMCTVGRAAKLDMWCVVNEPCVLASA